MQSIMTDSKNSPVSFRGKLWICDLLMVVVLLCGAYFRLVGLDWDEGHHLHPDERFLTMVETAISPVKNLSEYFNTGVSSLNPHNRGYSYYVYGTLPIFIVRYVGEWINQTGYDQINVVGRQLSAVVDLLTVLLVYLIASRLYDKRVGLLAAAFSACAVMQIQLSHYFTVDTFTNFFTFLAFYFAIRIQVAKHPAANNSSQSLSDDNELNARVAQPDNRLASFNKAMLLASILFGVALGMALASKVSAAPLAILLPAGMAVWFFRLPPEEQKRQIPLLLRNLILAAIVSVVVFRIFQPYAFSGPGFLGIKLNSKWIANLQELRAQSSGDVDFPPALQWARRPIWFAWKNMVLWGLGLPLGILAWSGFIWMGWRLIKKEWQHSLIWFWTAVYFVWQSVSWVRAMRYQVLVYPTLAIIAAWAVISLWDKYAKKAAMVNQTGRKRIHFAQVLAIVVGVVVLIGSALWAYAFSNIYTRPVTRVEASDWIYQNIPGPVTLTIQTPQGEFNQPLAYRAGETIIPGEPFKIGFTAPDNGLLTQVKFDHLVDLQTNPVSKMLRLTLYDAANQDQPLAFADIEDVFAANGEALGQPYTFNFNNVVSLSPKSNYLLQAELLGNEGAIGVNGVITLISQSATGENVQNGLPYTVQSIRPGIAYYSAFSANATGTVSKILLPHVVDREANAGQKSLRLVISAMPEGERPLGSAIVKSDFLPDNDPRGTSYELVLDKPVAVQKQQTYYLSLIMDEGQGALTLYGNTPAHESSWDDALPLPRNGFAPYDTYGGIYRGDLNFEMYWDDNADKRARFQSILDQADYIFISSNRQWGTTVRVPERYPLTTVFYRQLLGCPDDQEITWCYSVAQPGMFEGNLGYELTAVFQSDPNLGSFKINDQFAEEAFTVYDHPKVLIFKKTAGYESKKVSKILGAVDLTQVVHLLPGKTSGRPGNLMLPEDRLAEQQANGTWAELFNSNAVQNKYPAVGLVIWYLSVTLLGLIVYPFVRLALPGLADRGYPLARMAGMLVLAYFVWLASSQGIPFIRLTISITLVVMALIASLLAYRQRDRLLQDWKQKRKYYLIVELVGLAFFTLMLLIRLGNPDLWHPYKGGEKPMDLSYFTAILKSTTFPPYDPWFGGGYLNYYYYGYVIVGVLVKLLGIMPSIAYNLIIPTLFSLLALGAFSIGWNLTCLSNHDETKPDDVQKHLSWSDIFTQKAFWIGLCAAIGLLILGNLGTVKMIWQGFQRLVAPNGNLEGAGFFQHIIWAFRGLALSLTGSPLPYAPGDWYWLPSRAIPAPGDTEPITEFPFFTFLYADLHAHMIALPVTLLALAWAVSIVMGRWRWGELNGRNKWLSVVCSFFLAGITIGALYPTNTWDFPTYLVLGCAAIAYTVLRYYQPAGQNCFNLSGNTCRWLVGLGSIVVLVVLSLGLYRPYTYWYALGYNSIDLWKGTHTPFSAYLTHWGVFLFVIISWMVWETIDWMAKTPLSSLNKLRPYKSLIEGFLIVLVVMIIALSFMKVRIAWFVLPLAAWAGVLLLRPGLSDAKRVVLFLLGTGFVFTLMVEVIVLVGDIGRMNWVFKFYLQVWTMFAISAAMCLGWLLPVITRWSPNWRSVWQSVMILLVVGAALFPLMAGRDKITDRMAPSAPHTLDGMKYMEYAHYNDFGVDLDLSEDYRAIRWMQENVQGSPVIVEANIYEYHWGSRFTIYTGLPGVVGWNWHQRQQRGVVNSDWVTTRVNEVGEFYKTTDVKYAGDFLRKYNVQYIILGQQERAFYPGPGLDKFQAMKGILWREVYRDGDTVIYQTIK